MKHACLFFFLFIISVCSSQNVDSLKLILRNSRTDSAFVHTSGVIAYFYSESSLDSAFHYAGLAEARFDRVSVFQQSSIYKLLGILNSIKGRNEMALDYFLKRLRLEDRYNITAQQALTYILVATTFERLDEEQKALQYFEKALLQAKRSNDSAMIDYVLSNGSTFYFNHKNYSKALLLWQERVRYVPKMSTDVEYISGDIYRDYKQYDKAESLYVKAINIAIASKSNEDLIVLYTNFALIPKAKGDTELAISYYRKAKEFALASGYAGEEHDINAQLAEMLFEGKHNVEALACVNDAIEYHRENKQISNLENLYTLKSKILFQLADYHGAYDAVLLAKKYKEELLNTETRKKLSALKESIIEEQNTKKNLIKDHELEREKFIRGIFAVCLGAVLLLSGIIYRSLRINQSKNRVITAQKLETEKQKKLIEEKQDEIIQSITYARRLQDAILPSREFISHHAPDSFIFYQPKDIVAGDFYWSEHIGDTFFIAAADSTGHGVPGAIVSVVCSTALNRSVKEFGITETGKILDKTRELVLETFAQKGAAGNKDFVEVKDGMDISLLSINRTARKISWSGANNPLWYFEDGGMKEVKADKQPVGKTEYAKPFTTHPISYKDGSMFYLFTDGLPDQFGGPKGKKFKYKQFSELLAEHAGSSSGEQQAHIAKAFSDWKGELDQVDDVCVIGIRI